MTQENPLVTVIIPTIDRQDLLNRALESIYAQSYRPIEIVIVDVCSDIPPSFPPTPANVSVKVVRTDERVNASKARNIGFDCSTGAFVAFLDDDDYYTSEKLKLQMRDLNADSGLDFSVMPYSTIEPDGNTQFCAIGSLDNLVGIMRWGSIHTSCALIRRSVYDAIRANEALSKFTDLYVSYRLLREFNGVVTAPDTPGSVYDRTPRGDRITTLGATSRLSIARRNFSGWKIICNEFSDVINSSAILRRVFYGRLAYYAAAKAKPATTLRYLLASIGLINIYKP